MKSLITQKQDRKLLKILFASCLLFFMVGCGGEKMVSVSGTISVNGKPVPNGKIVFHPTSGARSGSSQITSDGSFAISYLEIGDGLPAGEYKVSIVANQYNESTDLSDEGTLLLRLGETSMDDPRNKYIVPKEYNRVETTPLIETILETDETRVFNFDISTKR